MIPEIKRLRDNGATLQEIGNKVKRSRERIRQILVEHYGTANVEGNLLTTSSIAKLLDCSETTFYDLARKKGIARHSSGRWKPEVVNVLKEHRKCQVCDKPIPKGRWICCSDTCLNERRKIRMRTYAKNYYMKVKTQKIKAPREIEELMAYKGFAIELKWETVNWIKETYKLETNSEVRRWLQRVIDKYIFLEIEHQEQTGEEKD